jgi:molybdate transport system permease protein
VTLAPLVLSLEIATFATIVTLVVGTALALLLSWRKLPLRDLFDAVVAAPLVLPPTVLGYYLLTVLGPDTAVGRGWEWLFGSPIVFTLMGAVIAASVGSLPLVVRSVRLGLDAIDPSLIAAARTLGARPARIVVTVMLPLAAPGVIAGAMLGFARALGDYGITQMVAGTQINGIGVSHTSPASIFVYEHVIDGDDAGARTMAIATTVVGVLMLVLANRLTRRLGANGKS